jgi:hypothetical protein
MILNLTLATMMLVALPAQAQLKKKTDEVYAPDKVAKAKVRDVGWDGSLVLGASISLSSSRSVVGQLDGETISLTGQITAGLDYIKGMHEWRNTLKLAETSAKTPGIDRFVKTNDLLSLDSIYLLHIPKLKGWFGPYARFQAQTALFPTEDVRSSQVTYQAEDKLPIPGEINNVTSFRLADSFSPTTFRETLGAFAKPYTTPKLMVEFKAGFQGKQTIVSGDTFSVDKVEAGAGLNGEDRVLLNRISDVYQGGPAAGMLLKGQIYGKKITYFFDIEAMIPVLNNQMDSDERSSAELTSVIIDAGVSVKIFSWMSLDYTFRLLRDPQLVDATQIQNNVLLTFAYTLFASEQSKKKPAKKK